MRRTCWASVRLHEAAGFRRAGVFARVKYKHARWIEFGYRQRASAPPKVPHEEPTPFATARSVR